MFRWNGSELRVLSAADGLAVAGGAVGGPVVLAGSAGQLLRYDGAQWLLERPSAAGNLPAVTARGDEIFVALEFSLTLRAKLGGAGPSFSRIRQRRL